jgi:hypothetical protein
MHKRTVAQAERRRRFLQYVFEAFQSSRHIFPSNMQKQSAMPTKADAPAGTQETPKRSDIICILLWLVVHGFIQDSERENKPCPFPSSSKLIQLFSAETFDGLGDRAL